MDVLTSSGWVRVKDIGITIRVMSPNPSLLNQIVCAADKSAKTKSVVLYGHRFFSAELDSCLLSTVLSEIIKLNTLTSDRRIEAAYADVRQTLLDAFTYPAEPSRGVVNEQEIAAQAMAIKDINSWLCECGRTVPDDGLPCICGNKKR